MVVSHLLSMLALLVVSNLHVDKYSINNCKFLSLSIIVDGAKFFLLTYGYNQLK